MPRGGKRPGAGRPRHHPPLIRIRAYITEEQAKLLREWGRGDLSAGLRWVVGEAAKMVVKKKS